MQKLNIFEKILARASKRKEVVPGEIVEANIDMAMIHDLTGPLTVYSFRKIGADKVWDPKRIVVIFDHLVPASTIRAATLQKGLREFIKEQVFQVFMILAKVVSATKFSLKRDTRGQGS